MEKLKRNKKRAQQLAEGKPLEHRKPIDLRKTFENKRNAKPLEEDEPRRSFKRQVKVKRTTSPRPVRNTKDMSEVELKIQSIRRQRNRRKWRGIVFLIAVVAAVLAWVTGLYGASLSLASDIGEGLQIALSRNGEYPARTGINGPSQLEELNGGFLALGTQDLAVFSSTGAKLRVIQHGYGRPNITTGNNRFCIYNRAGSEYRIESRTKNIAIQNADMPIILCEMSPSGSLAVVTQSERYSAELVVYSTEQLPIYRWSITDKEGTPVRVAFAPDNKRLAVGNLMAENGVLCSTINLLDIRRDSIISEYTASGSVLVALEWLSGSRLLALFDNMAVILDPSNGEELARYPYQNQTLQDYSVDNGAALLFHATTGSRLVILDTALEPVLDTLTEAASQVTYVSSHGGIAYLLRDSTVTGVNSKGEITMERRFNSVPRGVLQAHRLLVFVDNQVDILQTEGELNPVTE